MKSILKTMTITALLAAQAAGASAQADGFQYTDERFADLQMLRYKVEGFDALSLRQKTFIYYLQEAALLGRDILFDQNGKYNLRIRKTLETIYTDFQGDRRSADFAALEVYLKRVWFSSGIHHHYGSEKFVPGFSEAFFRTQVKTLPAFKQLVADFGYRNADAFLEEICPVIFNPEVMPKRVNLAAGADLVLTSAGNYYDGVTQAEAEAFYKAQKKADDPRPVMYGMNSRLVKKDGRVQEVKWTTSGLYGEALAPTSTAPGSLPRTRTSRPSSTASWSSIRPATCTRSTPTPSFGRRTRRPWSTSSTASQSRTATRSA